MIKILTYFKKQDWLFVIFSVVFVFIQVYLDLKLPEYMSQITTLVQSGVSNTNEILLPGGLMLLCALGSVISAFAVGYYAAKIAAGISMNLRKDLFLKTLSFSMQEMNTFRTSSLITRSTNDITQVQTFVAMGLQVLIKSPVLAVWTILKISNRSRGWSIVTFLGVAILFVMLSVIIYFALPKFRMIQKMTDSLNRVTRENLTGIRVVRAYNAESYEQEKFKAANKDVTDTNRFVFSIMSIIAPGMNFVFSTLSLAIYWVGVYIIDRAPMSDKLPLFSDMVVYLSYAVALIAAFMMLTIIFIMLPRVSVCVKRIFEVLDTQLQMSDGTKTSSDVKGEVEFKNVSFRYPDSADYALKNVTFSAHKGEVVAFIGATGSGKSTLLNLLMRFYDVTDGEISVNKINVKDYKKHTLYSIMAYVSQKTIMFKGTISSNVSYGEMDNATVTTEDIKKAVSISQADSIIKRFNGNYDASVSQGGTNLSGGQKQRISIARAIARSPQIFLFDDSFSALDYKTDRLLRNALKKEKKDATILVVAQRIGTIIDADRIIVLDKGSVVGIGKHKDLLKTCKVYKEIAHSQLSKEDLEDAR